MEIIAVLQKDVCRLCFNLSVHFSFYFIIKIKKKLQQKHQFHLLSCKD